MDPAFKESAKNRKRNRSEKRKPSPTPFRPEREGLVQKRDPSKKLVPMV